jgi:hypothetical protein
MGASEAYSSEEDATWMDNNPGNNSLARSLRHTSYKREKQKGRRTRCKACFELLVLNWYPGGEITGYKASADAAAQVAAFFADGVDDEDAVDDGDAPGE